MRVVLVAAAMASIASTAEAGTVTLSNPLGTGADGRLEIPVDAYGSYGALGGPQVEDKYEPANAGFTYATWYSGMYLFVTTGIGTSAIALTESSSVIKFVEGPTADGIEGPHTDLTRTVSMAATSTGTNQVQSAFAIDSTLSNIHLQVAVTQTLTYDTGTNTTELLQRYEITSTGAAVDVELDAFWDPQLIWSDGFENDIVGVGEGLCYVFARDLAGVDQSMVLADGGSDQPFAHYFGAKDGITPGAGPVYDSTMPQLFRQPGIPAAWEDHVANVGYATAGDSGEMPGGDASMGLGWKLTFPDAVPQIVAVRRIYGTSTLQCPASTTCGDMSLDAGEDCETQGVDTADCNGETCRSSACGDGHVNTAAGEDCESQGVDTATCVGTTCKTSICGDGHVNLAAGEDCDGGELCDPTTCTFDFELGGGCGGCSSGGSAAAWLVGLVAVALRRRRRPRGQLRRRWTSE